MIELSQTTYNNLLYTVYRLKGQSAYMCVGSQNSWFPHFFLYETLIAPYWNMQKTRILAVGKDPAKLAFTSWYVILNFGAGHNFDNIRNQAYITEWGELIKQVIDRIQEEVRAGGEGRRANNWGYMSVTDCSAEASWHTVRNYWLGFCPSNFVYRFSASLSVLYCGCECI